MSYQDDINAVADLELDPFLPTISEDLAHFTVEVDDNRCSNIPANVRTVLDTMQKDGIEVPFASVIRRCATHLSGAVVDYWKIGDENARIKHVWEQLAHWKPRLELHLPSGKNRLVVADQKNLEVTSGRTQILSVGVGLIVAEKLYNVPFVQWTKTQSLNPHDFEAPAPNGGRYEVEVRGRLNRNHLQEAIKGVHKKFQTPDFTAAAGIIFAPRTALRRSTADIIVIDPEGRGVLMEEANELRAVVRHYIPFFEQQGGWSPCVQFAARLRGLSEAGDDAFRNYLARGDEALRAIRKPWHTGFRYNRAEFKGTAWHGTYFPSALAGKVGDTNNGACYWGLWTVVIDALREGRLEKIASMKVREGGANHDGKVFQLLPDGTAFAYAPSEEQLSPGMFDAYF